MINDRITNQKRIQAPLWGLLLSAVLIRIVFACLCKGHEGDLGCFHFWAMRILEQGPMGFYDLEVFTDYPPGYICVLYVVGALIRALKPQYMSALCLLLLKLPAIICDLAAGVLIYVQAKKKHTERMSVILAAVYLFNPAVIYNSSVWGQVDSVFTLAVVLTCVLLKEKKNIPAYFVFAVGILIKPQTLIFAPLVLLGIYENVFAEVFSWKKFWQNLFGGLAAIGCMVLVCFPFGLETVLHQYLDTMGSYPYVSVNAYNFWSMLGLNWVPQEEQIFHLISYQQIGRLVILLVCVGAVWIFIKRKKEADQYYLTGAFIMVTMFVLSVRMHERYLYPVMIFLLLSYMENGHKEYLTDYIGFTLIHFLNLWHVLTYCSSGSNNTRSIAVILISFGMVRMTESLYRHLFQSTKSQRSHSTDITESS